MNWNLKLFREMMINFLSYYFWFKVGERLGVGVWSLGLLVEKGGLLDWSKSFRLISWFFIDFW